MKRRPIRTAVLLAVTALVWFLAVQVTFHTEDLAAPPGTGRHLPHIDVRPGTTPVDAPLYTFTVPTGFAVDPRTGDLLPVSWLPTPARITHHAATVAVDTGELSDAELATSAEANPGGPPAGVVDTYPLGDFRVVVTEHGRVHTAYHGRTVLTVTAIPPDPADVFDPTVLPAAVDVVLRGLGFT